MRQGDSVRFVLLVFAITWAIQICFFYFIPQLNYSKIFVDFLNDSQNGLHPILTILFFLSVTGPFIGYLVFNKDKRGDFSFKGINNHGRLYIVVFAIFFISWFLPYVTGTFMFDTYTNDLKIGVWDLLNILVIQIVISTMEEPGWRGYLLRKYLKEQNARSAALKLGVIWVLWHLPSYYLNLRDEGILVFIIQFSGFTITLIGVTYVMTLLYLKTRDLLLMIFIHASYNFFVILMHVKVNIFALSMMQVIIIWIVAFVAWKKLARAPTSDTGYLDSILDA